MKIVTLVEDESDFESGRLDREGDPGYILMYTCSIAQRQEFYDAKNRLLAARNRRRVHGKWSTWVDEKGGGDDRGRSIVADVVCLRRRRSGSSYW